MHLTILPSASVVAPLVGLYTLLRAERLLHLRRSTVEDGPLPVASARVCEAVRMLRLASLWNACSLPGAALAIFATWASVFTSPASWWLLPGCLLATKLLAAKAHQLLFSSVGVTSSVAGVLASLAAERAREREDFVAKLGQAQQTPQGRVAPPRQNGHGGQHGV